MLMNICEIEGRIFLCDRLLLFINREGRRLVQIWIFVKVPA